MKEKIKIDLFFCVIIGLIGIVFLYLDYFLFKNENVKMLKNYSWIAVFLLLSVLTFIYFYKSKNNFIVSNLIFILINFLILLIGFNILYDYAFNLFHKYKYYDKHTPFFSFENLDYIFYLLTLILIVSIGASLLALFVKWIIKILNKNYRITKR